MTFRNSALVLRTNCLRMFDAGSKCKILASSNHYGHSGHESRF